VEYEESQDIKEDVKVHTLQEMLNDRIKTVIRTCYTHAQE
jgi:hypothetical protein